MEEKKISLDELMKAYQTASDKSRKHMSYYLSDKTIVGIHFLQRMYTEIYQRQTGVDRKVPLNRILGMAVENMINATLARIREEGEKSKAT